MKKRTIATVLALILVLALSGCGSTATNEMVAKENYYADGDTNWSADAGYSSGAMPEPETPVTAQSGSGSATATDVSISAEKIIYNAYAEIETTDFDASLLAVDRLIASVGGFIENSSVTGSNYYSGRDYRSASYTIRVPSDKFTAATGSLADIGNVTYQNSNAENITTQYYDTQSRLEAYQIEYDRLTDMLSKATTVEDMLSIEDRLTDVRYNIESLTSSMKLYDAQVNYSTLSLSLTEVKEITTAQGAGLTYWQEMGQNLKDSLNSVWRFLKNVLMFLVAALPALVLLGVIAVVVILIVRGAKRKKALKAQLPAEDESDTPEK